MTHKRKQNIPKQFFPIEIPYDGGKQMVFLPMDSVKEIKLEQKIERELKKLKAYLQDPKQNN